MIASHLRKGLLEDMMKGRLLFVAQRPSDYVEMRRSAEALGKRGYTTLFLYHKISDPSNAHEQAVLEDSAQAVATGKIDHFEIVGRKSKKSIPTRIMKLLPKGKIIGIKVLLRPILERIYPIILMHRIYSKSLERYDQILKRLKPDLIVLPEDIVGFISPLIIKAGHVNGIPSMILPYTIANQQEAFRSLSKSAYYRCSHPINYFVSQRYPSWVMRQDSLALVRLPAPHILAHERFDITPPDPWMMNSGFANIIAVENRAMERYYLNSGIPASKLRVVGAVYDDHLAKFLQNKERELTKLRAELGIQNDKPLLVIGGCPDQTGRCSPDGFEFKDMEDMARSLVRAMDGLRVSYEIIVRPHPNYPKMGRIMADEGIRSTMIDTARLIALSEVYAAFASATIRWAIACAVPTINYDVFHYDYDDFKAVPGVAHVKTLPEFSRVINEMTPGNPRLLELVAHQMKMSEDWGRLDGRAVERIAALIEELRGQKPVRRSSA